MLYNKISEVGSVASPIIAATNLSLLGGIVYSGVSYPCATGDHAPLFITIEGAVANAAGGGSLAARCCLMGTAAAPTATTDGIRIHAYGLFSAESDVATMFVNTSLGDNGIAAAFTLGATPHPIRAPFVGLRFSNPGTAFSAGTFTIYKIIFWG